MMIGRGGVQKKCNLSYHEVQTGKLNYVLAPSFCCLPRGIAEEIWQRGLVRCGTCRHFAKIVSESSLRIVECPRGFGEQGNMSTLTKKKYLS